MVVDMEVDEEIDKIVDKDVMKKIGNEMNNRLEVVVVEEVIWKQMKKTKQFEPDEMQNS